ncbi:hypothetical protein MHU86_21417 [Fragilaria crotonensis]|nr:hypothetical protein MHU86_21417 [Fragilaria crotonensis]
MTIARASLRSLCDLNVSILSQKLGLMEALVSKHGHTTALELYKSTCPIVGATIGQHVRHSMDHMELAALVATTHSFTSDAIPQLHYDLRVRGGTLEHDMEEARKRVLHLTDMLQSHRHLDSEPTLVSDPQNPQQLPLTTKTSDNSLHAHLVQANFMLSSDGIEYGLPSTMERELGFCAHHAIHHMAMIHIIAVHHAQLDNLPPDFGRAPSTVHHDITIQKS